MTSPQALVTGLALADPAAAAHRRIDHDAVQRAAHDLLHALGADVGDESLQETPRRAADALADLLTPQPFRATTFPNEAAYDELMVTHSIPFHQLCIPPLRP